MISNINFTGIKNIGGLFSVEINGNSKHPAGYLKLLERKYLVAKLTNDKFGNDLDEYEQVLALGTPALDNFHFLHNKRYINIFTEKPYRSNIPAKVFLNLEELPVQKNTLPMFDFLAKLTRKIANKSNSEFIYEDRFPVCNEGDLYIMGDTRISDITKGQTDYINSSLAVYNPIAGRNIAKMINDGIQEQMENYLL
jgi:hypothetical protein